MLFFFLSRCTLVKQKFWYILHHHSCHDPFWPHKYSALLVLLLKLGRTDKVWHSNLPAQSHRTPNCFQTKELSHTKVYIRVPAVPGEMAAAGDLWGEAIWFQPVPAGSSRPTSGENRACQPSGWCLCENIVKKGQNCWKSRGLRENKWESAVWAPGREKQEGDEALLAPQQMLPRSLGTRPRWSRDHPAAHGEGCGEADIHAAACGKDPCRSSSWRSAACGRDATQEQGKERRGGAVRNAP